MPNNITIAGVAASSPVTLTFDDLIDQVYEWLKDDRTTPVYPLTLVKQFLNEWERITLSRRKYSFSQLQVTYNATQWLVQQEFALPANLGEIMYVKVADYEYTYREYELFKKSDGMRWSSYQGKLILPQSARWQVVVSYYALWGTMSELTDSTLIPDPDSYILVEYALYKLFKWNRMSDRSDERLIEYKRLSNWLHRMYAWQNWSIKKGFKSLRKA